MKKYVCFVCGGALFTERFEWMKDLLVITPEEVVEKHIDKGKDILGENVLFVYEEKEDKFIDQEFILGSINWSDHIFDKKKIPGIACHKKCHELTGKVRWENLLTHKVKPDNGYGEEKYMLRNSTFAWNTKTKNKILDEWKKRHPHPPSPSYYDPMVGKPKSYENQARQSLVYFSVSNVVAKRYDFALRCASVNPSTTIYLEELFNLKGNVFGKLKTGQFYSLPLSSSSYMSREKLVQMGRKRTSGSPRPRPRGGTSRAGRRRLLFTQIEIGTGEIQLKNKSFFKPRRSVGFFRGDQFVFASYLQDWFPSLAIAYRIIFK